MRWVVPIAISLLSGCTTMDRVGDQAERTWDSILYDSFQSPGPEEQPVREEPSPVSAERRAAFLGIVIAADVLARSAGREHVWPAYDPAVPDRVGYLHGRWQQSAVGRWGSATRRR